MTLVTITTVPVTVTRTVPQLILIHRARASDRDLALAA
jgi:hypothetical protein